MRPITAALIVAAGKGTRLGADRPKQYLSLGERSVLAMTISQFLTLTEVDLVRVVIGAGHQDWYENATKDLEDIRLLDPVQGGPSRRESVCLGLDSFEPLDIDRVLIHDGARPFIPPAVILEIIQALDNIEGAVAALPVVDALFRAKNGYVQKKIDREHLWRAQTPQAFHFAAILNAHNQFEADADDDVEVARASGIEVKVVRGPEANFKITTKGDLIRAREILAVEE